MRWLVFTSALAIGAVAPARAWCEATCIAPNDQAASHCPSPEPADGTTSLSAGEVDECPAIESARPTVTARLDVDAQLVNSYVPLVVSRTFAHPSSASRRSATTLFERCTPLRI